MNISMHLLKSKRFKVIMLLILCLNFLSGLFSFADDQPATWAVSSVNALKSLNLLDDSTFENYGSFTTRADFAYLGVKLYEYYTGKIAEVGSEKFLDSSDEWILKAKNLGIVSGYPDGSFKPNQLIKRDELAVLFVNVLKISDVTYAVYSGEVFSDDHQIASWAKESVYIAKANGIISGVGNNAFDAKSNATVQQSLVMLNNAIEKLGEANEQSTATEPKDNNEVSAIQTVNTDKINNCLTFDIELTDYLGRDINIVLQEFKNVYGSHIKFLDGITSYISIVGDYGQVVSLVSTNGDIINKVNIGYNSINSKPIVVSERRETIKGFSVNQGPEKLLSSLGLSISDLDTTRAINPTLNVIGRYIEKEGYTIHVEFTSDMNSIFGLSVYTPFTSLSK